MVNKFSILLFKRSNNNLPRKWAILNKQILCSVMYSNVFLAR